MSRLPPSIAKLSAAAIVRPGSTWECDDRARVIDGGRLCLVADGSGPKYGGYHEPIALDPGMDAIAAVLAVDRHDAHACDEVCMRDAFVYANARMFAAQEAYTRAFREELAETRDDDRLRASLRAGQRIAREHFGRTIERLAHATGSVTAIYFAGARAIVGQVGLCRAYLWRRGTLECLLPDDGVLNKAPETSEPWHYGIASQLLGFDASVKVATRAIDCEPADRFVLCSDGAWSVLGDDGIAAACRRASADDVAEALMAGAVPLRDDAAMLAVVVEQT
jgi:serine/threonine protein phosphatase PrpC